VDHMVSHPTIMSSFCQMEIACIYGHKRMAPQVGFEST
jgi:hypothetical protein